MLRDVRCIAARLLAMPEANRMQLSNALHGRDQVIPSFSGFSKTNVVHGTSHENSWSSGVSNLNSSLTHAARGKSSEKTRSSGASNVVLSSSAR